MTINWDIARRVMHTQSDLFPAGTKAAKENCMQERLLSKQMDIAIRCIKGFYQGLKWADKFGIHGGYAGNRSFHTVFLLEDEHILGVFDNRSPSTVEEEIEPLLPKTLDNLIDCFNKKKSSFKTLLVVEKSEQRLASSYVQGRQSKFVIDVLYPALEGIRANSVEYYDTHHWHKVLQAALHNAECQKELQKISKGSELLAAIYQDPSKADAFLLKHPVLRYFYSSKSKFNLRASLDTNLLSIDKEDALQSRGPNYKDEPPKLAMPRAS